MARRKRNLNYLRALKDELEEVSKEHDIPIELLQEIIDEMFYDIRALITSPKMPTILLSSFGRFKPSVKKLKFLIYRFIDSIKKIRHKTPTEKEVELSDNYLVKIRRYWAVRQRYIAENRGIRTWECWRDLDDDLTNYEECHKIKWQNCLPCRKEGTVKQGNTPETD